MGSAGPADAAAIDQQVDAARESAFAEADADGDGTLDANERTVFADLLREKLEDLNPDVIESDGSGGTDLYWHRAPDGSTDGGPGMELHLRLRDPGAADDDGPEEGMQWSQKIGPGDAAGAGAEGHGIGIVAPSR